MTKLNLKELIMDKEILKKPIVYDCLQAKIAESLGFKAIAISGGGVSMSNGYPDAGLMTMNEVLEVSGYVARSVNIPVTADGDTGYGNALNVWRTVKEFEAAGLSGISFEDQFFPKRCAYFEGKQVVSIEEHAKKIEAAVKARSSDNFLIIGRSDSLSVTGWEDTIKRVKTYYEAGADMITIEGIQTLEDAQIYSSELSNIPKSYNGQSITANQAEKLGFNVISPNNYLPSVIYKAVKESMVEFIETGTVDFDVKNFRQELADVMGVDQLYEIEQNYVV
jgi:2-methylisocitrate lyase-like PEP mutase family enzyme